MADCIFCKIAAHETSADIEYEDDQALVFHDRNPQAPVHLLVIPKKHIEKIQDISEDDRQLMGHLLFIAKEVAEELGLNDNGYRLVINNGRRGGQAVFHIHLHVLGGRPMRWPPG
ncbi:MAG: histidine triad nucleotide-binding protein [Calditrichaeota bacterium]|nr:MAG: histidine triad nucleotide-binding protein [Calditrichota bacterium]